jgi:hypothetical protein
MSSNIYINTVTLEYPIHQGDIRLLYPDIGEEFILPDGPFVEVEEGVTPVVSANKVLTENPPVFIDGKWIRQLFVRDMTREEIDYLQQLSNIAAAQMKGQNNQLVNTTSGSTPDVIG